MLSLNSNANVHPRRSRLTLWLILAVCAAPILASYIAYYWWQPSGHVNYGELIPARNVSDEKLQTLDGRPFRWSDLKGEWVLLTADPSSCDDKCRTKLIYTRQVRLAQGKEAERIERIWLLTDAGAPDPVLLAEQPGLLVLRAAGADLTRTLPAITSPLDHIYVVDPLGNLMMRFPPDPDPRRMLKDLARLLRHSKWR
ncbi:MAG: SCO family protein [Burkholderiales bacterium]